MIDGLKLDLPGADVKAHIEARIAFHAEKQQAYAKQRSEITTLMADIPDGVQSGDPRGTLQTHENTHAERVTYFSLIAKYLNAGETYRLTQHDLRDLEFSTRGW